MSRIYEPCIDENDEIRKSVFADPEAYAEYLAFSLQIELTMELKKARQRAHLTQETIAKKMETKKPAIARLEAGGGKEKHSPSLSTLVKYAQALGFRLEFKLVPLTK